MEAFHFSKMVLSTYKSARCHDPKYHSLSCNKIFLG